MTEHDEKLPAVVAQIGERPALGFELNDAHAVSDREDKGIEVRIQAADGSPMYYQNGTSQRPVVIRIAGEYSNRYR
jgi:hypothetical protein